MMKEQMSGVSTSGSWLQALLGDNLPFAVTLSDELLEVAFSNTSIVKWHTRGSVWAESTGLTEDLTNVARSGSVRSLTVSEIVLLGPQLAAIRRLIETNPIDCLTWKYARCSDSSGVPLSAMLMLAELILTGKPARKLDLRFSSEDAGLEAPVIDVIARSRLRKVDISYWGIVSPIAPLIEQNRTIRKLCLRACVNPRFAGVNTPRLHDAIVDNWALQNISLCHPGNDWAGSAERDIELWIREETHARSIASIHARTLDYASALLPLRLPVYEMLAIVDWLPPMSIRARPIEMPPDPHRLRKVRLIEALTTAYRGATVQSR